MSFLGRRNRASRWGKISRLVRPGTAGQGAGGPLPGPPWSAADPPPARPPADPGEPAWPYGMTAVSSSPPGTGPADPVPPPRSARRRRRTLAISLGATALVIIMGIAITAGVHHPARVLATKCGAARCTPAPRASGSAPSSGSPVGAPPTGPRASAGAPHYATPTLVSPYPVAVRAAGSASASTAPGPGPAPTPAPGPSSARPAPAPSATPGVDVSYSVVQRWDDGFEGEFTIVNHGTVAVNGWELDAALPGDQVQSAWDVDFHMSGAVMILDPPSYQAKIAPNASVTASFTADGNATSPASCSFNGTAC